MAELFEMAKIWFLGLGDRYGVNPIVFGSIYVGAIPFFTLSIAWLVRNYRKEKSIIIPGLLAVFFFISAYLYLIVVGQNVPWWVYAMIIILAGYGVWTTYRRLRRKLNYVDSKIPLDE